MVDVGIVFVENIVRHLQLPENKGVRGKALVGLIYNATTEVASAITTALATTVVSFLPVFALESAEAKLFHPLAFTKTFALAASFFIGIIILPSLAHFVFSVRLDSKRTRRIWNIVIIVAGIVLAIAYQMVLPIALVLIGLNNLLEDRWPL